MGFGFANDEEEDDDGKPKELPHEYVDTLRYRGDKVAVAGTKVQSVLTGVVGVITGRDEWKRILISWDNGKKSKATLYELVKVIVIEESENENKD